LCLSLSLGLGLKSLDFLLLLPADKTLGELVIGAGTAVRT
jgi:hypothetical protein